MINRKKIDRNQRLKYVIVDFVTSTIAFFIFNICRSLILDDGQSVYSYLTSTKLVVEQCVAPFLMLGIYWLSGYYNHPFGKSRLQELFTTLCSAMINTGLIFLILLINDRLSTRITNYELLLISLGLLFLFTYCGRIAITAAGIRRFRNGELSTNCIIVGNSVKARETARKLTEPKSRLNHQVIAFVSVPGETQVEDDATVYEFSQLQEICEKKHADQVIISLENYDDKRVMSILNILFPLEIPVKIAPDIFSFVTAAIKTKDIYAEPFVDLTSPSLTESSQNVKRLLDVILSGILLLICSPLMAVAAILVRRASPGPAIYRQQRIGKHQRPFTIYKFRTMCQNAEGGTPMLSQHDDPRITSIGKVLRKYRIDELPQLWNVIKGDMSMVGPRPEREYFIRKIMEQAPYYALIYQVRPGITSWGMVKYGYASNLEQMIERTRYDLIYITNMSIFIDMKLLIYTIDTVITGRGM